MGTNPISHDEVSKMKEIRNIAIVGLGAIGSVYAVKFHEYNTQCLQVIVDETRYEKYMKVGLVFNGKRYDFNYALPGDHANKADLVIVATKSSGLESALETMESFVGDNTIILSPLNGITSEEIIAEKFGWNKVLYSLFIGHISTRRAKEVEHDGVGTLVFGEADNTVVSENVAAVRDFFDKIGADYEIPQDMLFALWSKFMINVGFNQASAVLLAPYKVFHECSKPMDIAYELMKEVIAIAHKAGIKNADKMLDSAMGVIHAMPPAAKSSMLQDVEARRKTEVDLFAGTVCERGRKYGVATPCNDVFLKLIEAIDQKNILGDLLKR